MSWGESKGRKKTSQHMLACILHSLMLELHVCKDALHYIWGLIALLLISSCMDALLSPNTKASKSPPLGPEVTLYGFTFPPSTPTSSESYSPHFEAGEILHSCGTHYPGEEEREGEGKWLGIPCVGAFIVQEFQIYFTHCSVQVAFFQYMEAYSGTIIGLQSIVNVTLSSGM